MTQPTNLRARMNLRFMRRLLATPEGRAHLLNQVADAEGSDEARIFDKALARVDDPRLAQLIEKHRADEDRHEALFRAQAARTGVLAVPVPDELRLLDRLNRATDGFLDRPITDERGVMEAYLLLQVIEERAITQFRVFERAFREIDAETADVFVEVTRDEERHLKYCHAIARRYAPDEATRVATLARLRAIEARCFAENNRANLEHSLSHGFVRVGALERGGWRLLAWLQVRVGRVASDPARSDERHGLDRALSAA